MGSARVMRELSAEKGGREHRAVRGLPREREREFWKSFFNKRRESVLNKRDVFYLFCS